MRLTWLALSLALIGCGGKNPCDGVSGTCVTATVQGNATNLDQLQFTIDSPSTESLMTPSTPSRFSLPVEVALVLPAAGTVDITVVGLSGGQPIASNEQTVTAAANAHVKVTFTLDNGVLTTPMDMGGDDGGDDMTPGLTCAAANLNCDPTMHQVCDDSSGNAMCVCAPGYVMNMGACTWGVVPSDPGFQNTPANAWTLTNGAAIDPAAAGAADPGWVHFDQTATCGVHVPRARQTISMPPYSAGQPLHLTVSQYDNCALGGMFPGPCNVAGGTSGGVNILLNGGANLVTYVGAASVTEQTVCLGERAYGGTFDIDVIPWDRVYCSSSPTSYIQYVNHVSIDVDATCPLPNTIPNGNFDGSGNWTTGVTMANSPPPVAEIKAAIGTGGTSAAHLSNGDNCQQAWVQGTLSVPMTEVPNLALSMSVTGTAGETLYVQLGGIEAGNVRGTGAKVTSHVCLNEAHKGMTIPVKLMTTYTQGLLNGGGCGAHTRDFVIDDLAFVTDATCAATSFVGDGGFERTDPGQVFFIAAGSNAGATGTAVITGTAASAHSGTHAFQGTVGGSFGQAYVHMPLAIPPSDANGGPAIKFWYMLPAATNSYTTTPSATLTASATYVQKTVCVDPILVGHVVPFVVNAQTVSPGNTESIFVDDVTVGTDPSCLAN